MAQFIPADFSDGMLHDRANAPRQPGCSGQSHRWGQIAWPRVTGVATYLMYLAAGLAAGLVSGMFGLGGGLTIVPALAVALPLQGVGQEHVMHLAIGTSLVVMFFTAMYTTYLRNRHGDLDWSLFWRLLPPVAAGTALGAIAGGRLPGMALRVFFISFVGYMIVRALHRHRRSPNNTQPDNGASAPPVMPSLASQLTGCWSCQGPGSA